MNRHRKLCMEHMAIPHWVSRLPVDNAVSWLVKSATDWPIGGPDLKLSRPSEPFF